MYGKVS